ncbi:MAG: Hsp70 family protein [Candidatus Poribacteria bacterium]|nr:Hsp70 family protein [Candidatus Poribacteria bacterium]
MKTKPAELFETAWKYDRQHGTIAIGWGCDSTVLQNISAFANIQDLADELKKVQLHRDTIDPKTIWDFHCNIQVGDIVIARHGVNTILGIGTVTKTAYYDLTKGEKRVGVSSPVPEKQKEYIKSRFIEVFWVITGRFSVRLEPRPSRMVQEITRAQYQKACDLLEGVGDGEYQDIREAIGIDTETMSTVHQPKPKQDRIEISKPNYYIGIDLGTTNSVMAWGSINRQTEQLEPKIVPINMMIEHNAMQKKELLPSCVYFETGQPPNVGEYAKKMLQRQPDRVVKSIKPEIGSRKQFNFDNVDYSPIEVSAQILRHLAASAKSHFGFIPDETIITVPAYFDSNMRTATIKAAELAGFRTKEDDGRSRSILLPEPHAILLNHINQENRGETEKLLVNSQKPKLVLIFDLGGGPLKVSLHQVSFHIHTKQNMLYIEDLAVSDYTKLSGNDFDRLLAKRFLDAYVEEFSFTLDDFQMDSLMNTFQEYAEQAKIELSEQIAFVKDFRSSDEVIPFDEFWIPTIIRRPFANKEFRLDLTLNEYERIIKPFLALHLTLEAVKQPETLKKNNIIYPILDVLQKGRKKKGSYPQVDAVLLNGGMTKLHTIQERLEALFEPSPLVPEDFAVLAPQDGAVARGAVIYHHKLRMDNLNWGLKQPQPTFFRGLKPPQSILNKTVSMENYITPKINASHTLEVNSEMEELAANLERRSETKDLKIRKVILDRIKTQGARIVQDPKVNEFVAPLCESVLTLDNFGKMLILDLLGNIGAMCSNKDILARICNVAIELLEPEKIKANGRTYANSVARSAVEAIEKTQRAAEAIGKTQQSIAAFSHFVDLMNLDETTDIKSIIIYLIGKCYHRMDAFDYLKLLIAKEYTPNPELLKQIFEYLFDSYEQEAQSDVWKSADSHCNSHQILDEMFDEALISYFLQKVEPTYGGKEFLEERLREFDLLAYEQRKTMDPQHEYLLDADEIKSMISAIDELKIADLAVRFGAFPLRILDKLGNIMQKLTSRNERWKQQKLRQVEFSKDANQIATNWALGKIGSREKENPLSIQQLIPIITTLNEQLRIACHNDIKRNCLYALAEICDRRKCANDAVSIGTAVEVMLQLVNFLTEQIDDSSSDDVTSSKSSNELQEVALLAIQMIRGLDLSPEQEASLRAIREEN